MPGAGDQLRAMMAQQNVDPRFIALGYEDQTTARTMLASKVLGGDPMFAKLTPQDQREAVRIASMQPPALADKTLEARVGLTVAQAKKGDPIALKYVSG